MPTKPRPDDGTKETVILRQATPKYNFSARKLPKNYSRHPLLEVTPKVPMPLTVLTEPSPPHLDRSCNLPTNEQILQSKATNNSTLSTDVRKAKPIAVVGASMQTPSFIDQHKEARTLQNKDNPSVALTVIPFPFNNDISHFSRPFSEHDPATDSHISVLNDNEQVLKSPQPQAQTCLTDALHLSFHYKDNCVLTTTEKVMRSNTEQIEKLEKEREKLKQDLDVQLRVNSELKRLLVASIGEDLGERVERLCRDRAQLSLDLGGYSKKMTEEYENLDKVSIQADMWRSKYLAARVMIEELGNARAYFSLQWRDSLDALQQLLNERHELRTNLLEVYKVLQQVKNAFDPLNSHRSSALSSSNVLDLAMMSQQLVEAIRFRLLPANVAINIDTEIEDHVWADCVTRAEQFSHEVLSRPRIPTGSIQSGSSLLLPITESQKSPATRFNPYTRHENLTYNCCAHCKGEINVI